MAALCEAPELQILIARAHGEANNRFECPNIGTLMENDETEKEQSESATPSLHWHSEWFMMVKDA